MKLDPQYQYVVFSKGSGWISKIMAWFEKGDWSHVLFLQWNLTWECWEVVDTTKGGVRKCLWEEFQAHNKIVKVYKIEHDVLPVLRKYYKKTEDKEDEYDYWSILGYIWVKFMWWRFQVKIRNPLNNTKAWVCSGFIHRVFNQSKFPGYNEPLEWEIMDPDALDAFMSKSDHCKEMVGFEEIK